ncbi:hypothetical protein FRC11_000505, partial [Ceratobasidium sp. 423]
TKHQFISEKGAALNIRQPMKKTKSRPPEAFTPKELSAGSSQAGSSQPSTGGLPMPSMSGSLQVTCSAGSIQASAGSSAGLGKNGAKATSAKLVKLWEASWRLWRLWSYPLPPGGLHLLVMVMGMNLGGFSYFGLVCAHYHN